MRGFPPERTRSTRAAKHEEDPPLAVWRQLLVALIAWALSLSMARSLGAALDWWGVLACIAGVHAAYLFDDFVDDVGFARVRQKWRDPRLLVIGADGLVLVCAAAASPRLVLPLCVLSAAGLFYVPAKRFIPKNLLTAGAWTGTIFALSLSGLEPDARIVAAGAALFLVVVSNANLCDLPDIQVDRENRVKGFATMFGARAAARIAGSLGFLAAGVAAGAGVYPLCLPAACYGVAGWWLGGFLRDHRPMRVWLDAILVLTGPLSLLLSP